MEDELTCPVCRRLFVLPVLLSCGHSLCAVCADRLHRRHPLQSSSSSSPPSNPPYVRHHRDIAAGKRFPTVVSTLPHSSCGVIACDVDDVDDDDDVIEEEVYMSPLLLLLQRSTDLDGLGRGGLADVTAAAAALSADTSSLSSETDSGVVCRSRPGSYLGTPAAAPAQGTLASPSPSPAAIAAGLPSPAVESYQVRSPTSSSSSSSASSSSAVIVCPTCSRMTSVESTDLLSRNRTLDAVVSRYMKSKHRAIACQMCGRYDAGGREQANGSLPSTATVMCRQCRTFCCQNCQKSHQQNLIDGSRRSTVRQSLETVGSVAITSRDKEIGALGRCRSEETSSVPVSLHGFCSVEDGKFFVEEQYRNARHFGRAAAVSAATDCGCREGSLETKVTTTSSTHYCVTCRSIVCPSCVTTDNCRHKGHSVEPLLDVSKANKVSSGVTSGQYG